MFTMLIAGRKGPMVRFCPVCGADANLGEECECSQDYADDDDDD